MDQDRIGGRHGAGCGRMVACLLMWPCCGASTWAAITRSPWPSCARSSSSLGHADVATYIQSGNVVFTSDQSDTAALAAALEQAIATSLGVPARVVVLSREELAQVARDNPYADEPNPKAVHAVFLSGEPGPDVAERVAAAQQHGRGAGQPRHRPGSSGEPSFCTPRTATGAATWPRRW